MPGLLKVGMTDRHPSLRLAEANQTDTYRPPTPYHMEFAKQVIDSRGKEKILHDLLARYTKRVNPKREFFRASIEEVRGFFDLMDGTYEPIETVSPLVVDLDDPDPKDLKNTKGEPKKKRRSRSKTAVIEPPDASGTTF